MYVDLSNEDLILTYSWDRRSDHGMCGHVFEVIDYLWILKDRFKVGILFGELSRETVEIAIRSRYSFTDDEVSYLMSRCYFFDKPTIVKANAILFTDGKHPRNVVISSEIKLGFTCSTDDTRLTQLRDPRVYNTSGIDYVKKILFDKLKSFTEFPRKTLMYTTPNCRAITSNMLKDLSSREDNYICVASDLSLFSKANYANISFVEAPILDIHGAFDRYIYTPVGRKWDCSPRFIAECAWYGKDVEYYLIDYWDVDLGLKWRKHDVANDFDSLHLTDCDELFSILGTFL